MENCSTVHEGNAIVRTTIAKVVVGITAALALVIGTGLAFWLWPDPEAPDLRLDVTPAPTQTAERVTPTTHTDLKDNLRKEGYTLTSKREPKRGHDSAVQIWNRPGGPKVELNDLTSGIYSLHTVSYEGGAGEWKNFWCAPSDGVSLTRTINSGERIKKEIQSGTASLTSDTETPQGTKFVNWMDLDGQLLLTCYISN